MYILLYVYTHIYVRSYIKTSNGWLISTQPLRAGSSSLLWKVFYPIQILWRNFPSDFLNKNRHNTNVCNVWRVGWRTEGGGSLGCIVLLYIVCRFSFLWISGCGCELAEIGVCCVWGRGWVWNDGWKWEIIKRMRVYFLENTCTALICEGKLPIYKKHHWWAHKIWINCCDMTATCLCGWKKCGRSKIINDFNDNEECLKTEFICFK